MCMMKLMQTVLYSTFSGTAMFCVLACCVDVDVIDVDVLISLALQTGASILYLKWLQLT